MDSKALDRLIFQIISARGSKLPLHRVCDIKTMYSLLEAAQDVFSEESTVLSLSSNMYVIGDIHGNVDDLLRIFEKSGYPPISSYLFLGDYIDRGNFGLEVITLLFALKIKFPNNVFMIRGNHEIQRISAFYGFYDELSSKYTAGLYEEMQNTFNYLPICAIIKDEVFCVHGGIGPNATNVDDIKRLAKPEDIIGDNVFVDLLWSDPREIDIDFLVSKRGSGYYFGQQAFDRFLVDNKLKSMIRSHELCQTGYSHPFSNKNCLTIFSNTDYCGRKNSAAIAFINAECDIQIIQLPYLTEREKQRIKNTLPEWLVSEYTFEKAFSSHASDVESDVEENISDSLIFHNTLLYSSTVI